METVFAFALGPEGAAPFAQSWPDPDGTGWTWLHYDLGANGVAPWIKSHLPAPAAMALLQAETRPRCDALGDGLILNLRGVNLNPEAEPEDMVSLRLWVQKNLVVTGWLRRVYALEAIREACDAGQGPATPGAFLAQLGHGLSARIERVALELEAKTDDLEEQMLEEGGDIAAAIAPLRQSVIKLRRFVGPQREALDALTQDPAQFMAEEDRVLLRETANRATRTVEALDAMRDRLAALQDHLDADRANLLGRNSYVLSVIAAIFLPLGFLTGLFGVNVAGMPGLDWPMAFAALTVASVVLGAGLYLLFRWLKWL